MAIKHTRLHLTLDDDALHTLSLLAKLQRKQVGTVAKELLYNKIEELEDYYLSKFADERFENIGEIKSLAEVEKLFTNK